VEGNVDMLDRVSEKKSQGGEPSKCITSERVTGMSTATYLSAGVFVGSCFNLAQYKHKSACLEKKHPIK
jgi:hypothetical protein